MSENSYQVETDESNNGSVSTHAKPQQPPQRKYWAFTQFNYLETKDAMIEWLTKNCVRWTIGIEKCPTTAREHLQGNFETKNKMRLTSIQNKPVKWSFLEPCYAGSFDNIKYCEKDKNLFHKFPKDKPKLKIIHENSLRPFQFDLEKLISYEPNDRDIIWVCDEDGGHGKSQFCKYLIHKYGAVYLTEGKKTDILNIVYNAAIKEEPRVILVDIPRCNKNISYKSLEEIKNGIICNTKYETGSLLINSPHIVVFANWEPDYTAFTDDRWKIYKINNTHELVEFVHV